ncbi:hypothetical protein [Sporomusa aerivorans]|uniref:hypothetical protein n=1 Tax=Sporomusa aerivorans TaxID=204936 RepID=UPI00352A4601
MPEYLKFRCCMCPQKNDSSRICPGVPGILHPNESPCRLVKAYKDNRGWEYFVQAGIGGDTYKTFYRKPGKAGKGLIRGKCWRPVPWRDSFDEAQIDLNIEAEKRGWEEINDAPA